MRVGIDYLPAVTHFPGVGRYARELVRALVRLEDGPALALLAVGGEPRTIGEPHLGLDAARVPVRVVRRRVPRRLYALRHRWTGRGAERWLGGVDLFHRIFPDWPPVEGVPALQPVGELPPAGSAEDDALGAALRGVGRVVVFCRHAAAEVVARHGLAPEAVFETPIGSDQWRRALPEPPARRDPPEVLVLGALRRERRPEVVLAGFEAAVGAGFEGRLVFAGGPGSARDAFGRTLSFSPVRGRVSWRPDLREDELPALVAGASVLCHLTEGEESAVTPLEACSFGTPVVATRLGAFEEALGELGAWVDNDAAAKDPAELGRLLVAAAESAHDPAAVAAREALARRYTWDACARATADVWRRVAAAAG